MKFDGMNYGSNIRRIRACLKKAFRELRVSVCGRFYPNEGGVAGYGNRMRVKYTAKWGLQIAEMIFQTRSRIILRNVTFYFKYSATAVAALAPSETAVTTWRSFFVLTSPATYSPARLVSPVSSAFT